MWQDYLQQLTTSVYHLMCKQKTYYDGRARSRRFKVGDYKICHGCQGYIEKSVPRVIVWHQEACRVMSDCDPEGRVFFYLSFIPMILCCSHFNYRRLPYCDDNTVTFSDIITFGDVELNDGVP